MGGADALSDALGIAKLPLAIGSVAIGVLGWQVGRAAAAYRTIARTMESERGQGVRNTVSEGTRQRVMF